MDIVALGASVSILGMILFIAFAFYTKAAATAQMRGRLEGVLAGAAPVVEGSGAVTALRPELSVVGALRVVFSGEWLEKMADGLKRADSNLQPSDFVTISVFLAGLGFTVPFLLLGGVMGAIAGLGAAVIAFFIPQKWMGHRRESRRQKLEEQLPEALSMIANSLKAGFGLLQSLGQAAEQMDHPLGTELATTIHEMNMGANADEALLALSERSGSYDLDLAVTAMLVQRSVGGNLAEILDTVAAMMRERIRIRGEIKTLTAQQTMTGMVIGALPIGVGAMFMVVSPDYITVLFTDNIGRLMLGVALVLETVGVMVIRRIVAIEV